MTKKIAVLLIMLFPLLVSPSLAQEEAEPVKLEKLSDRLYETMGGRGSRGGIYIGDDGVLVIDAKMDQASHDQVMAAVKKLTDKPVKFLVNTHSDGDHVRGNKLFPSTVTIVAHENCRKEFLHPGRDGTESEWNDPAMAPYLPAVTFSKKMDLYLGSKKVELWHFGVGHTTGDTVVYFPTEKTAFIADQIFLGRPQLIHSYKGGNSFRHVENLTRMLDTLDAERFCSGHSEPTDRETIKGHIAQMKKFQDKVKALVAAGKSLEEAKAEFAENESRLVESVYNEVKSKSTD
jgi:glyoxylase-like metal-dependent hydrolase (beta-lactamase superfamily II)